VKETKQKLNSDIAQKFDIYTEGKKDKSLLKEMNDSKEDSVSKDEIQI
jgi:hypothetical protein